MMNAAIDDPGFAALFQSSSQRGCGPYEPSLASSASSSQVSIFSDASSLQSSIASSVNDDFSQTREEARDRAYARAQVQQQQQASQESYKLVCDQSKPVPVLPPAWSTSQSYADITSTQNQQQRHPRRNSLARNQKPPTLVRQCERKVNFVESLGGKLNFNHKVTKGYMLRYAVW